MLSSVLQYGSWIGTTVLQLALVCWMLRRGLHRSFPAFFTYNAYFVLSFAPLFLVYHFAPQSYFTVYWISSVLSIVLGFMVIYEIFRHAFRPYAALSDLGAVLFRWVVGFLIVVALVMILTSPQSPTAGFASAVIAMERSVRLMQVGLVLLLFLFLPHLGLNWRSHIVGIATGFGFFAAVDMVVYTLITQMPSVHAQVVLSLIKSWAYTATVAGWAAYLLVPEPARKPVLAETEPERWNNAINGIQHPEQSIDSFLPLLEARVERVMIRHRNEVVPQRQVS
jgi:hypothetical protein